MYGGYYNKPRRNQPVTVEPVKPDTRNLSSADTGNAGRDGYTVLSRADRESGVRPMVGGTPAPQGPRFQEDC